MSYDKNTYSFSDITPLVRELMRRKENYHLGVLGNVLAVGVNDNYNNIDDYDLRILIYKGGVILEQMRRTNDCDSDDTIVSSIFNFDEVPENWFLERYMDYTGFVNGKTGKISPQYEKFVDVTKFKKFIPKFM